MMNTRPLTPDLTLSNNHRLRFAWSETDDTLRIELWAPHTFKDGHGWLLCGSTVLAGEDLNAFVSALAGRQKPERRPTT